MNRRNLDAVLRGFASQFVFAGGLACLILISAMRIELTAGEVSASAHDEGALLYPPANCILTNEFVQIIAIRPKGEKGPALLLDGRPVPHEMVEFAPGWPKKNTRIGSQPIRAVSPWLDDKSKVSLILAVAKLDPGAHEFVFAGATNRWFRSRAYPDAQAPKDMALFNPHPSPDAGGKPMECSACHEPGEAAVVARLGRVKMPDSCNACRQPVDLRLTHSHVMEPLAKCSMCHDPHGSSHPSLLVGDKAKLCVQCHEAGHFK